MLIDGLITGVVNLFLFGLLVAVRQSFNKEGPRSFFWQNDARGWKLLAEGLAAGILAVAVYAALVLAAGQGTLTFAWTSWPTGLTLLAGWGFGHFAVALFEEALFRGYLLKKLLGRFALWIAIGVPSILFGGLHVISCPPGPTLWLCLVNDALFGVVLSLGVIKSRSLLWAVGFHWAYNVTQSLLLAEQNAQQAIPVNLHTNLGLWAGPSLPEAGLAVSLVVFLFWIYVTARFRLPVTGAEQAAVLPAKEGAAQG